MAEKQLFPRTVRYRIQRSLLDLFGRLDPGSQLHREVLERQALQIVGVAGFLDPTFREPLDRFLDSVRLEARLNSVGRLMAAFFIRRCLVNRLSLEQAWGGPRPTWPSRNWPARPPLVVVGLPRTGTTLLHRLLAADPAGRPLMYWEASFPVRVPRRSGTPFVETTRRAGGRVGGQLGLSQRALSQGNP
ncbi:MAG: hypothetical protein RLZZ440_684 [Planctomycetota bacterium]